jgi:hypothetical protein
MVKMNTFFAEWWSGPTSADWKGQNTDNYTFDLYSCQFFQDMLVYSNNKILLSLKDEKSHPVLPRHFGILYH